MYAWYFREVPCRTDVSACVAFQNLRLLYVGIAPKSPSSGGTTASRQTLRSRIRTHYAGNAEASTLRRTLGCLLAWDLGIELRRTGSGASLTFGDGEGKLSEWMALNAFVGWLECDKPWVLERTLLGELDLPLNLAGNHRHAYFATLSRTRAEAAARARSLPIMSRARE